MRRVLSIWLPQLPLDRRIRLRDPRTEEAFAIIAEIKNAWRITHLSPKAWQSGLSQGLSVPDARAICPNLLTEPNDCVREAALLKALGRWSDSLSPIVSVEPPDSLCLDITGCAHLFGGEREMAEHAIQRFKDMQIVARIGIADTKGAAWALSRYSSQNISIAEAGQTKTILAMLPLAGLNLSSKVLTHLRRVGFKSIGDLYDIKPSELARRFGLELTQRLERVLGYDPDPIVPSKTDEAFAARMTIPEPIGFKNDLEGVLDRLSQSVCSKLAASMKGARRFKLIVRCVDTGDHELVVGFARACNSAPAVMQQFDHPLDKLKIEFGADWFRLSAENIEPMQPHQQSIEKELVADDDLTQMVSTLGNRLGFDRVLRFIPQESHLPEREFAAIEATNAHIDMTWQPSPRRRPLRLYRPPEPLRIIELGRPPRHFEWRRTRYETLKANGPERLATEWWRPGDRRVRDYWRIQTRNGPRFWLMTFPGEKTPDWYLAGRFA